MRSRLLFTALITLAGGCGEGSALEKNSEAPRGDAGASRQCYGANDCAPGQECNELGFCVAIAKTDGGVPAEGGLPPEVESKRESEPPASGKRFVYVAVPEQEMVAKIDSETLQVRAIKVGKDPGALRTIPGEDVAVVLNRLSASASVLRARSDGGDDLVTLDTAKGLNSLALAPDGKHAVAYHDLTLAPGGLPSAKTLQTVTLLRLEAGKEQAIDLTVGFRPSAIQFTADGSKAFVVTEQGISIIALAQVTKPSLVPPVSLLRDALKEPKPDEVLVTPDGAYALLRQAGVKGMRVVNLETRAIDDLVLPGVPTDLDLTADGVLAVAVLRDAGEVALVDIPADLSFPAGIDHLSSGGYLVGQATLTKDNTTAFLFSNATTQEVLLSADLATRTITVYPLKKGVRAVFATPSSTTAVILHNKVPGEPLPQEGVEALLDKSWGYSLLNLATGFPVLQLTDADPGQLAIAPDSASAYLLLDNPAKGVRSVEVIDLASFQVASVTLGSPPVTVGVVAATGKVYVAQSHALGRVTFLDMGSHQTKTVTGFELNSHIIE